MCGVGSAWSVSVGECDRGAIGVRMCVLLGTVIISDDLILPTWLHPAPR